MGPNKNGQVTPRSATNLTLGVSYAEVFHEDAFMEMSTSRDAAERLTYELGRRTEGHGLVESDGVLGVSSTGSSLGDPVCRKPCGCLRGSGGAGGPSPVRDGQGRVHARRDRMDHSDQRV